jgi:murein DD-endopeptidase MepM/ murein hydrolase activator NlpD
MDIDAAQGAEIRAAADGVVLYSGSDIKGYGNLVIIRHDQGLITVYAHNDENRVKEGETVAKGQNIGTVGSSGSATHPHLQFEIRRDETPEDPARHLPPLP